MYMYILLTYYTGCLTIVLAVLSTCRALLIIMRCVLDTSTVSGQVSVSVFWTNTVSGQVSVSVGRYGLSSVLDSGHVLGFGFGSKQLWVWFEAVFVLKGANY